MYIHKNFVVNSKNQIFL